MNMKNIAAKFFGLYLNVLALISPRRAGLQAFLLFCRPFRIPLTDKQKEFLNSGEKFTIQAGDVSIQAYRWGEGDKKILFLHGWQSHSYRWKAYIEALPKDEYTIYALDAHGHGLSSGNFLSVPVYSTLIQQFILELDQVHAIISHSLGSFSLLYTLHQFPLLPVRKIIAMAPPGEANDFMTVYKNTLGLSDRVMKLVTGHFMEMYDVTPDYFSAVKFASAVEVDGLIIHDETDNEAPYHYSTSIHKAWKKSKLVTTKGLGHNLRSPLIVQEVLNFITESGVADVVRKEQTEAIRG
jgi:esterase/lipase